MSFNLNTGTYGINAKSSDNCINLPLNAFQLKAITEYCKDVNVIKILKGFDHDVNRNSYIIVYKYSGFVFSRAISEGVIASKYDFNFDSLCEFISKRVEDDIKCIDEAFLNNSTENNNISYRVFDIVMSELSSYYILEFRKRSPYKDEKNIYDFVYNDIQSGKSPIESFERSMDKFHSSWREIEQFNN